MSSSTLTTIQNQFNLYGYSIFIILGNVGNLFIMKLFSRQLQSACSIYLFSLAIINDLYLTLNCLVQLFPFYYGDETMGKFALCKIRTYLSHVLGQISKTMLVLACIDRFLITNNRTNFRSFSTPKRAKYLIFCSIIFWFVISIHLAIMSTIVNGQCGTFGIYLTFYSIYRIIFSGLIPPILSGIFGYLTYYNMRQRNVRVQPVISNIISANISVRRRDRNLLILVTSEVFVYVVTATPYVLLLLETTISGYIIPKKSVHYLQIETFVTTILFLLLLMNNAAPFYIYFISSKSFRRDLKELIINVYQKLRRQPSIQIVLTTHQASLQ
jgi:hypothetical protein